MDSSGLMVAWWPVVTHSVSTEAQKQKPGSVSPKESYILRGCWGFAPILRALGCDLPTGAADGSKERPHLPQTPQAPWIC